MRYKVFDLIENKYIKDNKLCLKPNGKIVINDCGDEINISNSNISIKFYPTDTDNYYFDENGKVYDYRNTIATETKTSNVLTTTVCYVLWNQLTVNEKGEKINETYIVGILSKYLSGKYEFKYSLSTETNKSIGFNGIEAFPDFNKTYISDRLFPVFSSRLPDKNRKDISKILKKYGLEKYDEFQLLIKSGGKLPIDNLEFIDITDFIC